MKDLKDLKNRKYKNAYENFDVDNEKLSKFMNKSDSPQLEEAMKKEASGYKCEDKEVEKLMMKQE